MPTLAILGAAESGVGSALLAQQVGWEVFVSDIGRIEPEFKLELESLGIPYEEGQHTDTRLLTADAVVKSPGIPPNVPVVKMIREAGIPIWSEIEWAYRQAGPCKIVAVTGSNGKTTTVTMIHLVLEKGGFDVALCGNIGKSFARQVYEQRKEWYVIEVSSFQLEDIDLFHPNIAVITNIFPNHLNRYDYDLTAYSAAKFNLLQNQTADDFFIYSLDSDLLLNEMKKYDVRAKQLPFAENWKEGAVAWLDSNNESVLDMTAKPSSRPKGKKTAEAVENPYAANSLAAGIIGNLVGLRNDNVRESLKGFDGMQHRLEAVATVEGVDFVNDSKATTVNAAWFALEKMTKPVVWIAGGVDKGNDYGMLIPLVKQKVKAIVILGQDRAKIEAAFEPTGIPILYAEDMDKAVSLSATMAIAGMTVLLSPACASFDLFKNYEARGDAFKNAVEELAVSTN